MAVLTDTKARHIKPDDKPLPHGEITGLTLHPSSVKGRGKWVFLLCKSGGHKKDVMLDWELPRGQYCWSCTYCPDNARATCCRWCPLEIKKAESEKVVIPTFADAARRVHAELLLDGKIQHVRQWLSTLENYVSTGSKNAGFDYGCGRGRNTASSLVNLGRNGKPG